MHNVGITVAVAINNERPSYVSRPHMCDMASEKCITSKT